MRFCDLKKDTWFRFQKFNLIGECKKVGYRSYLYQKEGKWHEKNCNIISLQVEKCDRPQNAPFELVDINITDEESCHVISVKTHDTWEDEPRTILTLFCPKNELPNRKALKSVTGKAKKLIANYFVPSIRADVVIVNVFDKEFFVGNFSANKCKISYGVYHPSYRRI